MCTVSFVNSGPSTIITSNRDEQIERASNSPERFIINGKSILFPKDPKAGGTWYAVDQYANAVVLLNGASERHIRLPAYRRSRGLIVLDIISGASPFDTWKAIDLHEIEPFTLVLFQEGMLHRLRWDGVQKETLPLDPNGNHIWSSTTLYPQEVIQKREHAFYNFIESGKEINEDTLSRFHASGEKEGMPEFIIDRSFLKTISITQAVIEHGKIKIRHKDLVHGTESINNFPD